MSVAVIVVALSLSTTPPSLELARGQVKSLKYAEAAKTLKALVSSTGLSRAEALEFYALDGLVKGSLNDQPGATASFLKALLLDPSWVLPGKFAPRVTTPFLEAKSRAKELGRLTVEVQETALSPGKWSLGVLASKDEAGLGRSVRLTIVEDGVERKVRLGIDRLTPEEINGQVVKVTAQLLGAQEWVLVEGATRELQRAPPPVVATAPEPPPAPVPAEVKAAPVLVRPSLAGPAIVLGMGVVSAAVGAVFLGLANGTAQRVPLAANAIEFDSLISTGRTQQNAGAVVLIGGGAVTLGGLIWMIANVMATPTPVVTLHLDGHGVALSITGSFP